MWAISYKRRIIIVQIIERGWVVKVGCGTLWPSILNCKWFQSPRPHVSYFLLVISGIEGEKSERKMKSKNNVCKKWFKWQGQRHGGMTRQNRILRRQRQTFWLQSQAKWVGHTIACIILESHCRYIIFFYERNTFWGLFAISLSDIIWILSTSLTTSVFSAPIQLDRGREKLVHWSAKITDQRPESTFSVPSTPCLNWTIFSPQYTLAQQLDHFQSQAISAGPISVQIATWISDWRETSISDYYHFLISSTETTVTWNAEFLKISSPWLSLELDL